MTLSQRLRATMALSLALAAAVLTASGLAHVLRSSAPAPLSPSLSGREVSPAPALMDSDFTLQLPAPSYDLAYDSQRDLIWFAVMEISGPDWLYAVDARDGSFTRWDLPDSEHNGYLSQIKVDKGGVIWISQDYVLTRFDPASETVTSRTLDLEAPRAVPSALDEGNPLPGTWISAIEPYQGGVIVARNNVWGLDIYDSRLKDAGTILAPAVLGSRALAQTPSGDTVALGSQSQLDRLVVLDAGGSLIADIRGIPGIPESRITLDGGTVYISGRPLSRITDVKASGGLPEAIGDDDMIAIGGDGQAIAYASGQSRLEALDGTATTVIRDLGAVEGEVLAPPPGDIVKITVRPTVTDLLLSNSGEIWYLVEDDSTLHAIRR